MIEKEFVPYEEALALKQLGFDEPCFAFYDESLYFPNNENQYGTFCNQKLDVTSCSAPLYQQAFKWFREKYDFHYSIDRKRSQHDFEWGYNWSLYNYTGICSEYLTSHPDAPAGEWVYETYEEAELACLKKLIEIVKP